MTSLPSDSSLARPATCRRNRRRGGTVDPRSDIFSFGAVLHEMITGRAAFEGDSVLGIASAVIRETPKPLSDAGREVPGELERIVARCLRKDPDRRFQTAADLEGGTGRTSRGDANPENNPSRSRARRRRGVLLAAALAAGGGSAGAVVGSVESTRFAREESPRRSCRSPAIPGTKLGRRSRPTERRSST